jgi:hypothetical protein
MASPSSLFPSSDRITFPTASSPPQPPCLHPPQPADAMSSPLPTPQIPLARLPKLIGFGTFYNHLRASVCDIPGDESPLPDKEVSPPWEGWLESWYLSFDSTVWGKLGTDDSTDRQSLLIRMEELKQRQKFEHWFELVELMDECDELRERIRKRMEHLYGALDVVLPLFFSRASGSFRLALPNETSPLFPHPRRSPLRPKPPPRRIPPLPSSQLFRHFSPLPL